MKLTNVNSVSDPITRKALRDVEAWASSMEQLLGVAPVGAQQANADQRVAAPDPPSLKVVGAHGLFTIDIGSTESDPDTIYRAQLQYCTTLPFESHGPTTIESSGARIHINFPGPGQTLFFRARIKFNNSTWSSWTNFPGSVAAGAWA